MLLVYSCIENNDLLQEYNSAKQEVYSTTLILESATDLESKTAAEETLNDAQVRLKEAERGAEGAQAKDDQDGALDGGERGPRPQA